MHPHPQQGKTCPEVFICFNAKNLIEIITQWLVNFQRFELSRVDFSHGSGELV